MKIFLDRCGIKQKYLIPCLSAFLISKVNPVYCSDSAKIKNPSIIFIYADNLGYGDLGSFGSKLHRTPHIDNMAKEGIRLTTFYSASGVSTPSRASLLTGCYAQRVDMHLFDSGRENQSNQWQVIENPQNIDDNWVLRPVSRKGLNPEEITIAELLKKEGYATACIGKWHLGDQPVFLPLNHGFDYFFGIPYSEDMVPNLDNPTIPDVPLLQNNDVIEAPVDLYKVYYYITHKLFIFVKI